MPTDIAEISAACPGCDKPLRPDFYRALPSPVAPVPALNEPGYVWVPASTRVDCDCGAFVDIPFNNVPARGRVDFFGDEAARSETDRHRNAFVYALVGTDRIDVPAVEAQVAALKSSLEPSRPSNWRFHMKDLLSGQSRKRHPVFSGWDRNKCEDAIQGLLDITEKTSNLAKYVCTTGYRNGHETWAKKEAYLAAVMYVTDTTTRAGGIPTFTFDAEKPVSAAGQAFQEWATKLFLHTQRCNLYPFLTRGLPVEEPRFVSPGSHALLELADFVAYVVARAQLHCWRGHGPDTEAPPTRALGLVHYLCFDRNGNLIPISQVGFPIDRYRSTPKGFTSSDG